MNNKYQQNFHKTNKKQFIKFISVLILIGVFMFWSNSVLIAEAADGGGGTGGSAGGDESEADMNTFVQTQNISAPTAPHAVTPGVESPSEVIPYKFETGIPLIPGAEKGKELKAMTLPELVKKIIKAAFLISGILAFSIIVWGGYEYLASAGDPKRQAAGLQHIAGAIIGLILLFVFWIILNTINPDILKTTAIHSPLDNGGGGGNGNNNRGNGNNNIPTGTQNLAKALLRKFNIELYPGAELDLQDMAQGRPINVYENDPHPTDNCLGNVTKFATTIDERILKVTLAVTDTDIPEPGCGSKYNVGPFISNHNYCKTPGSLHAKGKAVDITPYGTRPSPDLTMNKTQYCTWKLLQALCPELSSRPCLTYGENRPACSPTINGVKVRIRDGTCAEEPHLHIELSIKTSQA